MRMSPPDIEHLTATAGESVLEFSVSIGAGQDTFLSLLAWLPQGHELHFHDPYYPSVSDPGAYVTVRRRGEVFSYMLANHGWSSGWSNQSAQLLAAWMVLGQHERPVRNANLRRISVRQAQLAE